MRNNDSAGFSELLKLLNSTKQCKQEGLPFLGIIYSLQNVGFNVKLVLKSSHKKTSDLEVLNPDNNERFYIEVSKLENRDENINKSNNFRDLFNALVLTPPLMPYSCKQLQIIPENKIKGLQNKIKYLKTEAFSKETFCLFEDQDKYISLALSHPSKEYELDEWCHKYHRNKNECQGLYLNYDETYRLSNNKIKSKVKQIPPDSIGILYFPIDPLFLPFN